MTESLPDQRAELSNEQFFKAVSDILSLEWQRKDSLEQRGITVITTSGVLVTLVFGATALVSKGTHYANLIRQESQPITIALLLFIVAAGLGLIANLPLFYEAIRGSTLKAIFETAEGRKRSSQLLENEINVLRTARQWNRRKSWVLAFAIAAEVGAAVFLVIAASYIVANAY